MGGMIELTGWDIVGIFELTQWNISVWLLRQNLLLDMSLCVFFRFQYDQILKWKLDLQHRFSDIPIFDL